MGSESFYSVCTCGDPLASYSDVPLRILEEKLMKVRKRLNALKLQNWIFRSFWKKHIKPDETIIIDPTSRPNSVSRIKSSRQVQGVRYNVPLTVEQMAFVAESEKIALKKALRALRNKATKDMEIRQSEVEAYRLELKDIAKMRKEFERFCSYGSFDAAHNDISGEKFLSYWKKWMEKRDKEEQKARLLTVELKIRLKNIKEDLSTKNHSRDLITAVDCSALQLKNKYLADVLSRKKAELDECRRKQSAIYANTMRLKHTVSELTLENATQTRRLRSMKNVREVCDDFRERILDESIEEECLQMDLAYRQRSYRYPTVSSMVEMVISDRKLEKQLKVERQRLITSKLRLGCHQDAWRIHKARCPRVAKKNTSSRVTDPPPLINLSRESSTAEQNQKRMDDSKNASAVQ